LWIFSAEIAFREHKPSRIDALWSINFRESPKEFQGLNLKTVFLLLSKLGTET